MLTNKQDIKNWLHSNKVINYTINEDLSVDVYGDVYLNDKNLTVIPIRFNIIKGGFCCENTKLTSTESFPKEVYGYYGGVYCYNNNLKNLDNFPKLVEGYIINLVHNPNLKNIIGLWNCDFKGNEIWCDEKWKEEIECYLISINRLKEVKIYTSFVL
jgi:hypothetical protein